MNLKDAFFEKRAISVQDTSESLNSPHSGKKKRALTSDSLLNHGRTLIVGNPVCAPVFWQHAAQACWTEGLEPELLARGTGRHHHGWQPAQPTIPGTVHGALKHTQIPC